MLRRGWTKRMQSFDLDLVAHALYSEAHNAAIQVLSVNTTRRECEVALLYATLGHLYRPFILGSPCVSSKSKKDDLETLLSIALVRGFASTPMMTTEKTTASVLPTKETAVTEAKVEVKHAVEKTDKAEAEAEAKAKAKAEAKAEAKAKAKAKAKETNPKPTTTSTKACECETKTMPPEYVFDRARWDMFIDVKLAPVLSGNNPTSMKSSSSTAAFSDLDLDPDSVFTHTVADDDGNPADVTGSTTKMTTTPIRTTTTTTPIRTTTTTRSSPSEKKIKFHESYARWGDWLSTLLNLPLSHQDPNPNPWQICIHMLGVYWFLWNRKWRKTLSALNLMNIANYLLYTLSKYRLQVRELLHYIGQECEAQLNFQNYVSCIPGKLKFSEVREVFSDHQLSILFCRLRLFIMMDSYAELSSTPSKRSHEHILQVQEKSARACVKLAVTPRMLRVSQFNLAYVLYKQNRVADAISNIRTALSFEAVEFTSFHNTAYVCTSYPSRILMADLLLGDGSNVNFETYVRIHFLINSAHSIANDPKRVWRISRLERRFERGWINFQEFLVPACSRLLPIPFTWSPAAAKLLSAIQTDVALDGKAPFINLSSSTSDTATAVAVAVAVALKDKDTPSAAAFKAKKKKHKRPLRS